MPLPPNVSDAGTPDPGAGRWLRRWAFVAGLLVVLTYLANLPSGAAGRYLGAFDLGRESNAAAWFSASSLLWSGLLMISAAVSLRGRDGLAAAAGACLGVIALMLAVDEAGSLHERFDLLVPASLGLSLKKLAAIGAAPVLASVAVLFHRRGTFGGVWMPILGAYALFGTVFAQERLEHAIAWPSWASPLRMVVEEGTELCGFYLLLRAAIGLRQRCRGPLEGRTPTVPASPLLPGRSTLLGAWAISAVLAPVLVLWSLSIPVDELSLGNRGDFGSTMTMAMFLVTAAVCLRQGRGHASAAAGWRRLAAACILLSLVQNWHAYTDAWWIVFDRNPPHLWRTAYDMLWALPVLLAVALTFRPLGGGRRWLVLPGTLIWAAVLLAAYRTGFRLSYASSYAAAVLVGVWVFHATRAESTRRPDPLGQHLATRKGPGLWPHARGRASGRRASGRRIDPHGADPHGAWPLAEIPAASV